MRLISVSSRTSLLSVTALFSMIGCGSPRSNPLEMDAGNAGGASGSGGLQAASGGAPAQTGGRSGTGGALGGSGGRSGGGGAISSGGSSSGGASTGGGGGGATTTGGAPGGLGGNVGSGGMGTGGVVNTGGHGPSASGGAVGSGGAGTGGVVGTGGKPGTGGAGTGGAGSGGAPAAPCLNNGGCSTNATCAPATGGRTCTCKTGYSGDGVVTCNDVNECLSANGGCDANATCTNTVGSRTCACAAGYTGNGLTCTAVPPPAPISIWKFEKQTNPNTILDSAGSNPGTVVTGSNITTPPNAATPVYVADRNGVANGALRLDGVTSANWVLIPSSSSLNAPWTNNAITVTFWVRMKTVPPSGGATLFDRGGNADPTPFELSFFNGNPYLSVKNASVEPTTAMPTATWTFLAGVYDGTNLVLYVNGNVSSSFPNTGIQMMSGGEPASIGAVRNTTGPYSTGFIDGDIDEVRLYGAGLTAPQIKTVMQQ